MNCLFAKILFADWKVNRIDESLIRSKDVPVFPFKLKGERNFQYDDEDIYGNGEERYCKLPSGAMFSRLF